MPDESCGKCRFWTGRDEADPDDPMAEGGCRRYPPSLSGFLENVTAKDSCDDDDIDGVVTSSLPWMFPKTTQEDWCGEFVAADSPPVQEPDEGLMSEGEVATYLRIISSRVGKLVKANKIPHVKLPTGDIGFRQSELKAWVDGFRAGPEGTNAT